METKELDHRAAHLSPKTTRIRLIERRSLDGRVNEMREMLQARLEFTANNNQLKPFTRAFFLGREDIESPPPPYRELNHNDEEHLLGNPRRLEPDRLSSTMRLNSAAVEKLLPQEMMSMAVAPARGLIPSVPPFCNIWVSGE
ncbi:hypothetical protein QAD02_009557 [Eretmocerus hayati]|uniref:Uncharacterized protein n=1 Tax=Eretmocerus hayati TaxID=131215 RepID=A0ACC2NC52_9HYME|nr:hypothetical protein QAD02_009557 [Eretmocerus hayati]